MESWFYPKNREILSIIENILIKHIDFYTLTNIFLFNSKKRQELFSLTVIMFICSM